MVILLLKYETKKGRLDRVTSQYNLLVQAVVQWHRTQLLSENRLLAKDELCTVRP